MRSSAGFTWTTVPDIQHQTPSTMATSMGWQLRAIVGDFPDLWFQLVGHLIQGGPTKPTIGRGDHQADSGDPLRQLPGRPRPFPERGLVRFRETQRLSIAWPEERPRRRPPPSPAGYVAHARRLRSTAAESDHRSAGLSCCEVGQQAGHMHRCAFAGRPGLALISMPRPGASACTTRAGEVIVDVSQALGGERRYRTTRRHPVE